MLEGYNRVAALLGNHSAPDEAARLMVKLLSEHL